MRRLSNVKKCHVVDTMIGEAYERTMLLELSDIPLK